jgi:hypothetical protein
LTAGPAPVEVTTDRAPVYPRVLDELVPAARHVLERYANDAIETDHGRLKARLRPMRGVKTGSSLHIVATEHAFVQNLRRGHYETTAELPIHDRVRAAFTELAAASDRTGLRPHRRNSTLTEERNGAGDGSVSAPMSQLAASMHMARNSGAGCGHTRNAVQYRERVDGLAANLSARRVRDGERRSTWSAEARTTARPCTQRACRRCR